MQLPSEPIVLGPGEGRVFPFGPREMIVKADETTSDFALFESELEPGVPPAAPHRHRDLLESFYILRGQYDFRLGERTERLVAGSFVMVPPGVVHGFGNPGPGSAKMLGIVSAARGLRLVEEFGALLARGRARNLDEARAVFAKYDSELLEG